MVTVVGYARISIPLSKSTSQERELSAAGATHVYVDRVDSTRVAERPEWVSCLASLNAGDTVLICSLDRIAGCETMAIQTITELHHRGVHLRSLSEPEIDTTTPRGQALFGFATVLSRLQSDAPGRRHRGIRAQGNAQGRRPVMTPERLSAARCLRKQGHTVARIAALLGVGVTTIVTVFAREAQRSAGEL